MEKKPPDPIRRRLYSEQYISISAVLLRFETQALTVIFFDSPYPHVQLRMSHLSVVLSTPFPTQYPRHCKYSL